MAFTLYTQFDWGDSDNDSTPPVPATVVADSINTVDSMFGLLDLQGTDDVYISDTHSNTHVNAVDNITTRVAVCISWINNSGHVKTCDDTDNPQRFTVHHDQLNNQNTILPKYLVPGEAVIIQLNHGQVCQVLSIGSTFICARYVMKPRRLQRRRRRSTSIDR